MFLCLYAFTYLFVCLFAYLVHICTQGGSVCVYVSKSVYIKSSSNSISLSN